jgi:4-amino-4-deoxy-L-arabinose transferase-like glycosyltransferase
LLAVSALVLVLLVTLGARVFGPGDIFDKDQPKTMAASADVALNNNWIWPRDMIGEPSTKPPLYNWLDAIVLKFSPRWDEWTFKVPSILSALVVGWLCILATRDLLRGEPHAEAIATLSAAIWFASAPAMKMAYLSRPDMLLAAFMTGAWFASTRAINPEEPGPARFAVTFWLCVAGAVLTKGPGALIPLAYVPIAAKLIHGRWRDVRRIGWTWGLPLLIATAGAWATLAYRRYPHAFFAILNEEAVKRFTTGGPEAIAKPFYLPATWFLSKFAPWSLFALVAVLLIGPRRILRHELSPAIVWIALAVVAFSIAPGKRADYLLPAYPAASILAAYAIVRLAGRVRAPAPATLLLPLLMTAYLAHWELRRSPEARSPQTRSLIAFTRQVNAIVPRDRPIVVLVKGYPPLLSLLHRYDGNRAGESDLTPATWVIAPRDSTPSAQVRSGMLPNVVQTGPREIEPGQVALYRIGDEGGMTREAAIALLSDQYAWNFPPDRYRASRDVSPPSGSPASSPSTR